MSQEENQRIKELAEKIRDLAPNEEDNAALFLACVEVAVWLALADGVERVAAEAFVGEAANLFAIAAEEDAEDDDAGFSEFPQDPTPSAH